ncbi:MAG TPA: membrane protein insertase YidC [Chlorobaculum sp.]|uniref:Membrane protein insertase YidC n=1 Tax=Chlorobaculum tepidum (strain ATCC 49652 / DSM 12025 / NBRC 103806 / TLS) TaxID=194439 RepID=YIDC_CHLTE|nr:membrane protein insertase YidC [Chlorobaculum tepidum]Q8KGG2.1 RecName: Full=Membrane protein insertase YidC; AltName: Full=Foldase YidC; AltName: Full=Membrane integrase YidC; AltName: Full=Membrane protein YidC [Chlorobaculum tepidum TLS]AAM71254.1 oxa1/60kDa IMP family protein [Chlorobaculum tepidum TLS]HBU24263.1 membrane protein insertase YidC [Chlorobaculum sp.]
MDRNSVIGFALIAAIMIVWLQFMKPEQKLGLEKAAASREAVQKTPAAALPAPSAAVAAAARADSLGSFAQASVGTEKTITVSNDLFTATLSSKGATLKSLVLKKHLDGNRKPFNLISASDKGALSMLFLSSDGKKIDTRDLYFRSLDAKTTETVTGKEKLSVSYVLDVDATRSIQITYTFTGDSYVVDYDLKLNGFGSSIAGNEYQLDWDGGLNYSEKDQVDESHNAIASAYLGGSVVKLDAKDAKKTWQDEESGKAQWVAVRNKYFVAAIMPQRTTDGIYLHGTKKDGSDFKNYVAALKMSFPAGQQSVDDHYRLYVGPLDYNTVKSLNADLEKIMDFGWDWLTRPFAEYLILPIFNWMNKYVTNYGLIIIIFAFLIKLVTWPLSLASTKSMKKMSALQPVMKELQEKYKDNPAKLQSELGRIYKEAGVNPLGGCLPTVIQMPLLFAMFYVFRSSIQLRQHGFLWVKDLSVPDSVYHFAFKLPLYGDHIAIMPILMAVTVFFQQKITPNAQSNEQTKIMMWLFPAMMLFFFNNMPAGLALYYLMFNIFSVAQQAYMNATITDEEKAAAAMQVAAATKPAQSAKKGGKKK